MVTVDRKRHWEEVYSAGGEADFSWYRGEPRLSLELILAVAPIADGRVIDVGGGNSVLVDRLLDRSFVSVAVLDVSETALSKARSRLGDRAGRVDWITADVTEVQNVGIYDVWHDRAVFHFLTDPADRRSYLELARRTVPTGGYLIIATFAVDGPKRCSGLDVCRYDAVTIAAEFGQGFLLIREARETHITPSGSSQAFFYGVLARQ
jgi:SAM-dependent methyltransferase